jgi:hypothetical protein
MAKTRHPTTQLKIWMREASALEQERLALAGGTTRGQLYQVAGGFRKFRPAKAIGIEREAALMHKESGGRLPVLYRTDMATECAGCEFARKCLGEVATRSDFPVVDDSTGR